MEKLQTMEAIGDMNHISEILIDWNKKSKNKDLKIVSDAFCRLFKYTNEMEYHILKMESQISRILASKNRCIKRKRAIEKEIEKSTT